jgi:signal peptidase I
VDFVAPAPADARPYYGRVDATHLLPGDIVLVDTHAYDNTLPTVSDIVLARHPYQKDLIIIKRVVDLTPEGRLVLYSDNLRAGSDSRQLGTISMQRVIGRVTGVPRQRHST